MTFAPVEHCTYCGEREALDKWATGLVIQGDVVPVIEAARAAIKKARGES